MDKLIKQLREQKAALVKEASTRTLTVSGVASNELLTEKLNSLRDLVSDYFHTLERLEAHIVNEG
jgi:hypothetical protein